jgi:uncharacterized membrane protein
MTARKLRKLIREPIWFVLLAALVLGAIVGNEFAHEPVREAGEIAFGRAWRGDSSETRAALAGILGFEVTIFTVLVSFNAAVVKGAAYQNSPRLIPLYVAHAPIRRSLPMFALLTGYLLGAFRELGLVPVEAVKPRAVISVAVFIFGAALLMALVDLFRTFRFVRVERVLGLVRDATFAAAKRLRSRVERLPLDCTEELPLPEDASALVAPASGYVVDVRLRRMVRIARSVGVRTRISRGIGDYVDQGDVIGWVASDRGNPVSARVSHDLAATLVISPVRELDYDPALGIRIIVDVANRALGSSSNDAYTARQALDQLRSVLRHVGRLPLGDWNVVEADGSARVSVKAIHLRDLLSIAVNSPLHYGATDPDVLEGLIQIVLEAGWIARDPEDRAVARSLLDRIDQMAENSDMDSGRLDRLRAEAIPVRRSLDMDEHAAPLPHA